MQDTTSEGLHKKAIIKQPFDVQNSAMPFGLKNAGATYQRPMNAVFKDMIGKIMEVYVNDILVKSIDFLKHK